MGVGIKGEPPILEGKMHAKTKPDDSMWTLMDGKAIQISMEKLDQMKWWSCVMEGDAEINTRKIVPENSKLGDLDGETRQTVEKFKQAHPEMDFSKANINYGGGSGGFNMG